MWARATITGIKKTRSTYLVQIQNWRFWNSHQNHEITKIALFRLKSKNQEKILKIFEGHQSIRWEMENPAVVFLKFKRRYWLRNGRKTTKQQLGTKKIVFFGLPAPNNVASIKKKTFTYSPSDYASFVDFPSNQSGYLIFKN